MITLKQTISDIKNDLPSRYLLGVIKAYFLNSSFRVLLNHRIGKYLYSKNTKVTKLIARYYRYKLITKRGCDISYKASLGKGITFPHPLAIVIGDGVVIKDNVKIWQQVTLGSHGKNGQKLAYPIVESGVRIFTGATVIGGIVVGENAVIGANSVVNIDVPKNRIAVGIPCRIVGQTNE